MRTSWKKRLLVFAMLAAMLAAHAGSFAVLVGFSAMIAIIL